jgi:hypothetical protein
MIPVSAVEQRIYIGSGLAMQRPTSVARQRRQPGAMPDVSIGPSKSFKERS